MRRIGMCRKDESPILESRVNNKFAFIELTTTSVDYANRALSLNGNGYSVIFYVSSDNIKLTAGIRVSYVIPVWHTVCHYRYMYPFEL
jgi:hypothetical protein